MYNATRFLAAPAVLLLVVSGAADAQYEQARSTLAIADRVEVSGTILEPGTYLVRVADVQANRNVVVFQSLDGTKTFATALATPHRGAKAPSNSEFVFYPAAAGEPRVLRTWFAHDDVNGQDFLYPAERAAALRNATHEEVPVASADMVPASAPEPVAAAPALPPPPAPVETTASNDAGTSGTMETLPQTASPYPSMAILGIAFLAGALVLRQRREAA